MCSDGCDDQEMTAEELWWWDTHWPCWFHGCGFVGRSLGEYHEHCDKDHHTTTNGGGPTREWGRATLARARGQ